MIPLKIQLKNFLSYGSPTQIIDFAPYHLICLSGKNGHGKSALLDALTWALWGQARKTAGQSKADEGLIRLGQTNMMVSLDFTCKNQTFRVRREYNIERGKPVAHLDFGIIDADSSRMRTLTDKTIRTTQDRINETIGLDFESFINSVFIRQGNSNEFSKKSPKDRKEVLATILGLAQYEQLKKRALEKVREKEIKKHHHELTCQRLGTETEQEDVVLNKLATLTTNYSNLIIQEQELTAQYTHNEQLHSTITLQLQTRTKLTMQKEHLLSALTTHLQSVQSQYALWRSTQKKLRIMHNLPTCEKRKAELETELEQLQQATTLQLQLTQKSMHLRKELQEITHILHQELITKQQQATAHVAQISNQTQLLEINHKTVMDSLAQLGAENQIINQEISRIAQQKKRAVTVQEKLQCEEKIFERRKSFYHSFITRGNLLAQELKHINHKKQLSSTTNTPHCPLCEQHLADERLRFLQKKLSFQDIQRNHQIARLTKIINLLKTLLITHNTAINELKKEYDVLMLVINSEQGLIQSLEKNKVLCDEKQSVSIKIDTELTQAKALLVQAHTYFETTQQPLDLILGSNDIYTKNKVELTQCEHVLTTYDGNQTRYNTVKQELTLLTQQAFSSQDLIKEKVLQDQRASTLHTLFNTIRTLRKELIHIETELIVYRVHDAQLQTIVVNQQTIKEQLQSISQHKQDIAHQKGACEVEYQRLCQQKNILAQEKLLLTDLTNEINEYQILAHAFGKDGIQGLLIEHVLPEIESEANALLSRLTNNQAHVIIEPLRDLKNGGTKETLDIKISDAMGIRPYELFSGGEAFRIDFALRLAISKLLARRAGASLQTLIIDEGFGSQDEEGLQNIMDALYAIQTDFAKIIIVSHLPSMKDQFPVHFYIHKTPRGSTVQVINQG